MSRDEVSFLLMVGNAVSAALMVHQQSWAIATFNVLTLAIIGIDSIVRSLSGPK